MGTIFFEGYERESLANGIYLYQIIEGNKKIATGKIVLE